MAKQPAKKPAPKVKPQAAGGRGKQRTPPRKVK